MLIIIGISLDKSISTSLIFEIFRSVSLATSASVINSPASITTSPVEESTIGEAVNRSINWGAFFDENDSSTTLQNVPIRSSSVDEQLFCK